MRRVLSIVMVTLFATTLLGCGTIRGAGEDISAVGGWVTKGSDNVHDGMNK